MLKSTTKPVQAYIPAELHDFLKQDMFKNGFSSMSQQAKYALEQYAKAQGFNPHEVEDQQAIQRIMDNPTLLQQLQAQLSTLKTLLLT